MEKSKKYATCNFETKYNKSKRSVEILQSIQNAQRNWKSVKLKMYKNCRNFQ